MMVLIDLLKVEFFLKKTHRRVAAEQLNSAAEGSHHIVRGDLRVIRSETKRTDYSRKIDQLHNESRNNYLDIPELLQ